MSTLFESPLFNQAAKPPAQTGLGEHTSPIERDFALLWERHQALIDVLIAIDEVADNCMTMRRYQSGLHTIAEWTRGVNAPDWLREEVLRAARARDN